jgi:hypothetical protein
MLYNYTLIRLGGNPQNTTLTQALLGLFSQELTFPIFFTDVYLYDLKQDISHFFLWIAALPFPNFLKGSSFDYTGNYDIAEIILKLPKNDSKYYVLLTGMATESIYVFGRYFAFLMPIICGIILGFVYRIICFSKHFNILRIFFIFFICFNFARAGTGYAFPAVISAFLLFYLVVLWIYERTRNAELFKPVNAKKS